MSARGVPAGPAHRAAPESIPVTLVTGFYGSGKTALINKVARNHSDCQRVAVIQNELGEEALDAKLDTDLLESKEDLVTISNGCVCCSVRRDAMEALGRLAHRSRQQAVPYTNLIMETTGIADPGRVACMFFQNRWLQQHYHVDSIITVVDAEHFEQRVEDSALHAHMKVNEAVNQVVFADLVLLNKVDLLTHERLDKVEKLIRSINPMVKVIHTRLNEDDCPQWLSQILDNGLFKLSHVKDITPDLTRPSSCGDELADESTGCSASSADVDLVSASEGEDGGATSSATDRRSEAGVEVAGVSAGGGKSRLKPCKLQSCDRQCNAHSVAADGGCGGADLAGCETGTCVPSAETRTKPPSAWKRAQVGSRAMHAGLHLVQPPETDAACGPSHNVSSGLAKRGRGAEAGLGMGSTDALHSRVGTIAESEMKRPRAGSWMNAVKCKKRRTAVKGPEGSAREPNVSCVSVHLDGEFHAQLFDRLMKDFLVERGLDVYRTKGCINVHGYPRAFVFQGIHRAVNLRCEDGLEKGKNSLVFIGRDLDEIALHEGLEACLWQ